MNKEYAIYPFRYMNITQRHDQGNHTPHWQNSTNHSDKPWDEACQDGGRSYFEPKNDFIIEEVLGLGTNTTNSVRLKSVNKLYIPYKTEPDYLYITLTHMNEDNLAQVYAGQILKAGTRILLEGTDGWATGNHFHITANIGRYYGFLQNSNGKWCFTYEKSLLPHEAFYVDWSWTQILNARNYPFLAVPKVEPLGNIVERNENIDQIEVKVPQLYCRINPNLNGEILGFAKQGIHNYTDKTNADGYAWYSINVGWIAYSPDWCNLYPKKVIEEPPKEEPKQDIPQKPTETTDTEPKDENNTNTPTDIKNDKNGQNSSEIKPNTNLIKKIFQIILNVLKRILNYKAK